MGLQFDAMFRLAMLGDTPPWDVSDDQIVRTQSEFRIVTKNGTPLEKASYAFPPVQDRMLAIIQEVVEAFDVDGVNLCWIRGPQFVGYEAPVVDAFRKKYGEDPRTLKDNDERLLAVRASFLTAFVERTRTMLNQLGHARGRPIRLSTWTNTPASDLFYGWDVRQWIADGLVDAILCSSPWEYMEVARARECKVYASFHGSEEAVKGHDHGVDGFAVWDPNLSIFGYSQEVPDRWRILRRLGHEEEVRSLAVNPQKRKKLTLRRVGGFDISATTNVGANERKFWPPEMLSLYSGG